MIYYVTSFRIPVLCFFVLQVPSRVRINGTLPTLFLTAGWPFSYKGRVREGGRLTMQTGFEGTRSSLQNYNSPGW